MPKRVFQRPVESSSSPLLQPGLSILLQQEISATWNSMRPIKSPWDDGRDTGLPV
jgi:hypothetical protein